VTRGKMQASEMAERIRSRWYESPSHARRAVRRLSALTPREKLELGALIDLWERQLGVYA
jgi:hypothetical protein